MKLYKGSTVYDGSLEIFVAFGGNNFKKYIGSQYGIADTAYDDPYTELVSGALFKTGATIPSSIHLT